MGILDVFKFDDNKKKSEIKKKIKEDTDKTFTWANVWKYLPYVLCILGFLLWKTPYVRKFPLPLLGSLGTIGVLLFFGAGLYIAWINRNTIKIVMSLMKFFIISALSSVFILLFCYLYYFVRKGTVGSDLTDMLGLGEVAVKNKLKKGKKQAKVEVQSDKQTNVQKQITNVLGAVLPVNVLSLLKKNYFKRIFTFFLVYVLSLNYFVISKTYTTPTNSGRLSKEQNEIFWSIVRGFLFGLLICFFITFRVLMMEGYKGIRERNINEYVIVFSLITGLSSSLTKYLVKGPLAFLFKLI